MTDLHAAARRNLPDADALIIRAGSKPLAARINAEAGDGSLVSFVRQTNGRREGLQVLGVGQLWKQ